MQVIYKNKNGVLVAIGTPSKPRKKKSTKEVDQKEKVYLTFKLCKAKCFACNGCGYFWESGESAHFGVNV